MDAKSTPEERRASLERFRAVGQTFADGIASFRDRISTTTSPPNANVPAAPGVGMASENQGGNSQPANETSIENDDNADPQPIQRDVERLQNILFATERRVEAAAREIDILRAENRSLANSHERATRALESVRKEHDTALARASEERGLSDRSSSEIARLRGEVAELERELKRRDDALAVSESRACEDRKRASALERVSMSLRRRVAIAEENFTDASKVQEAIVARESAESNLVEARADAERWRARATAVDSLRDRATRAEQGERDMRQRGAILEREISSRDALIKQGLAERKKLKEFMVKYEQQLDAKDKKVDKLRSLVRNYQTALGRKDNLSDPEFSESGSARSLTWDKDIVAGDNVGAQVCNAYYHHLGYCRSYIYGVRCTFVFTDRAMCMI